VKLVLLGETACGKTSMMDRLRYNHFQENTEPTVGGVMHTKNFHLNTVQYKTCIVDIGGQLRYQSLSPVYYRDAAVCIVVFDLTRLETFERAKDWVTELQLALPPHTVIVLAGNKAERQTERQINLRSARSYASDKSLMYFEVSVNTGRFVYDLFVYSLKIYRQIVGQYSKTADAPPQQKVASREPASHVCFFEEIRAGRRVLYKHPVGLRCCLATLFVLSLSLSLDLSRSLSPKSFEVLSLLNTKSLWNSLELKVSLLNSLSLGISCRLSTSF
jgi:small GTP-binding protein